MYCDSIQANAPLSKHSNIQKYKNSDIGKSEQWAHVSHNDFYEDMRLTYLTLFFANQHNN